MPKALTDYIQGRQGYDYAEHGRAGNTHTDFVPDEIVDRFCILGPGRGAPRAARASCETSASTSSRSTCSTTTRSTTLAAYGEHIIPASADDASHGCPT